MEWIYTVVAATVIVVAYLFFQFLGRVLDKDTTHTSTSTVHVEGDNNKVEAGEEKRNQSALHLGGGDGIRLPSDDA